MCVRFFSLLQQPLAWHSMCAAATTTTGICVARWMYVPVCVCVCLGTRWRNWRAHVLHTLTRHTCGYANRMAIPVYIWGVSLYGSYFYEYNSTHALELYIVWLDLHFTHLKGELTKCGSKTTRINSSCKLKSGILYKTHPKYVHIRHTYETTDLDLLYICYNTQFVKSCVGKYLQKKRCTRNSNTKNSACPMRFASDSNCV